MSGYLLTDIDKLIIFVSGVTMIGAANLIIFGGRVSYPAVSETSKDNKILRMVSSVALFSENWLNGETFSLIFLILWWLSYLRLIISISSSAETVDAEFKISGFLPVVFSTMLM